MNSLLKMAVCNIKATMTFIFKRGEIMKWINELDDEFNGKPCKIKVGVSNSYPVESGGAFKRYHPTQKSVKLLEYLLSVCSNENDTVFYLVAVAPQE